MNHVLCFLISKFVAVYFADILVYSKHIEDHVKHLHAVFCALRKNQLYVNLKKYTLCIESIVFLGFVVSS